MYECYRNDLAVKVLHELGFDWEWNRSIFGHVVILGKNEKSLTQQQKKIIQDLIDSVPLVSPKRVPLSSLSYSCGRCQIALPALYYLDNGTGGICDDCWVTFLKEHQKKEEQDVPCYSPQVDDYSYSPTSPMSERYIWPSSPKSDRKSSPKRQREEEEQKEQRKK